MMKNSAFIVALIFMLATSMAAAGRPQEQRLSAQQISTASVQPDEAGKPCIPPQQCCTFRYTVKKCIVCAVVCP